MKRLRWKETSDITLDSSILFSAFFDSYGLNNLRQEAVGVRASYLIWPNNIIGGVCWSLYRNTDGALIHEGFATQRAAKQQAQMWDNAG